MTTSGEHIDDGKVSRVNDLAHGYKDVMVSPHILDTYIHLEKEIVREERTAPAPALSHSLGRVDDLAIDLEAAQQRLSRFARTPSGANDESLREVLIDLGVDKSPDVAAEHEEFIANINRQALAQNEVDILSRRLEEAEEEVKMLSSKVNFLQGLYQQQDTLLELSQEHMLQNKIFKSMNRAMLKLQSLQQNRCQRRGSKFAICQPPWDIFNKTGYKFKQPYLDTFKTCDELVTMKRHASSTKTREEISEKHNAHVIEAQKDYDLKTKD
uniref:Uncharacterized protein n=1 Tax=Timema monikensis TaxID=170555 RepID=A0A7R9EAC0_9NEOP|nr:unnamed protein product [Timema monikensis]